MVARTGRLLASQLFTWLRMDLDKVSKEVRSIAPFLVPFLKMACIYFVLWLPEDQPTITTAFVKCLPILSLIWFVWLQGVSGISNSYNRKILVALVFSCVGDVLMVWATDKLVLLAGMATFACAQVAYIIAFGFSPFGLKELALCLAILAVIYAIILPYVSGVLYYGCIVYGLLLGGMSWRALARFNLKGDIPWRKIYAACGAILFAISDSTLAVNKFSWPVPLQREVIMTSYYAAQLCMSLSVVNSRLCLQISDGCSVCEVGKVHKSDCNGVSH